MILTKTSGVIMGPITNLLGWIFNAIYELFNSMGVVSIALPIIVFTILIRLILFPFTMQTTRSSKIQNFLQPEFSKITKKYKGKKDQKSILEQQKETRELQAKYGIKMSTGCITALIQFPVFIGLYNVISNIPAYVDKIRAMYAPIADAIVNTPNSFKYISTFAKQNGLSRVTSTVANYASNTDATTLESSKNAIIDILGKCDASKLQSIGKHFGGNVQTAINDNLGHITNSNEWLFGKINLSETPGFRLSWLMIIPIASLVFQFLSMIVMPMNPTGDPEQDQRMQSMRRMTFIMPLFSFIITVNVPAGLGLYWAIGAFIAFVIALALNTYYNHCDMAKVVEKARVKAEKKLEKKGGKTKPSLAERLTNSQATEEQKAQQRGLNKYSSLNLKNYTPDSTTNDDSDDSSSNPYFEEPKTYKKGSISDRANAVKHFNDKGV